MKFTLLQVNYDDDALAPSQLLYAVEGPQILEWFDSEEAHLQLQEQLIGLFGFCNYSKQEDDSYDWECSSFILNFWKAFDDAGYEIAIHFKPIGCKSLVDFIQDILQQARTTFLYRKKSQFDTLYRVGLESANQDIARELVKYI